MRDLEEILKLIDIHGLTAYEISKEVPLTEAGLLKLMKGDTKPRDSTLSILNDYLDKKFPGYVVQEESEQQYQAHPRLSLEDKLAIIKVINDHEDEFYQLPEFRKLLGNFNKDETYLEVINEIRAIKDMLRKASDTSKSNGNFQ